MEKRTTDELLAKMDEELDEYDVRVVHNALQHPDAEWRTRSVRRSLGTTSLFPSFSDDEHLSLNSAVPEEPQIAD